MSFETCAKLIKPFEMAIMSGSDNVRQISSVCSTTSGEAYGNHKKYIQSTSSNDDIQMMDRSVRDGLMDSCSSF